MAQGERASKAVKVGDEVEAHLGAKLGWQRAAVVDVVVVNKKRKFSVVLNDGSTMVVRRVQHHCIPQNRSSQCNLSRQATKVRPCEPGTKAEEETEQIEQELAKGQVPLIQRVDYAFDNFMVNPYASFILITIAACMAVFFGGIFLKWVGGATELQSGGDSSNRRKSSDGGGSSADVNTYW